MSTEVKSRVSGIVKKARKIAERSNDPMSLDEIRGKYQLEFPFHVKKVCASNHPYEVIPIGLIVKVTGYNDEHTNWYDIDFKEYRTPPDLKQWVLI